MKNKKQSLEQKRVKNSYFSVVFSSALVLFMLGIIGLLLFGSKRLSSHLKESFSISITLKENPKEQDIKQFEQSLRLAEYTKSTEYISAERAMEMLKEDMGDDFIDFIGTSPLSEKIELKVKAGYASSEKLDSIKEVLLKDKFVAAVDYNRLLLDELNDNISRISIAVFIFSLIFFIVSILLINNSIRLMIYSKRFQIKTMQLVGATHRFIAGPFVMVYVRNGLIASLIAIAALFGLTYYTWSIQPELELIIDYGIFALVCCLLVVISAFSSAVSTELSLSRFLKMNAEDLYY